MPTATRSLWENPLGTHGFEFVEHPAPGLVAQGRHKRNEGFGDGKFDVLFGSIELDRIRRGVLKA